MKLSAATVRYVTHKQSMGMRFNTEARTLKSFCRAMGPVAMHEVEPDRVLAFLAGSGPVTQFWQRKHEILSRFYRFAIGRGYASFSPLPPRAPKPLGVFVPYIYSREDLRCLLDSITAIDNPHAQIDPRTYRALILLLYGAGLRISEALALTRADVDLERGIPHIRDSKFYKTRLVPVGQDLLRVLMQHAAENHKQYTNASSPFLMSRRGDAVTRHAAELTFCRLRRYAGITRDGGSRMQPRLHDLRHSYAIDRLVAWYKSGANVQRLLPQLSTYLGHVHISTTQKYLTLTPELLREAGLRFERYAMGMDDE